MRAHPHRAARPRLLMLLSALVVAVTACTGPTGGVPSPSEPPSRLPAAQFATLPGAGTGVTERYRSSASDGRRVVMATEIRGAQWVASLLYSDDAGQTWSRGELTPEARAQLLPGEQVSFLATRTGATGSTWFGLSEQDGRYFAWTSPDGRTWARTEATGLPEGASLRESAATPEAGFVLVGDHDGKAAVWRSQDGVAWSRATSDSPGTLFAVAGRGAALVAVGGRPARDRKPGERVQETLALRSTDAGASWTAVALPKPEGSDDFWAVAAEVTATADGFAAAGTATHPDSEYRPWVATSPDGAEWTLTAAPESSGGHTDVAGLAVQGGAVIAVQGEVVEGVERLRGQALRAGKWAPVTLPAAAGVGVDELAVVGSGAALLAVRVEGRPESPQLWRLADGGSALAPVAMPAAEGDAWAEPQAITPKRALGTAQGRGAHWDRAADGTFSPPSELNSDPATRFDGVAEGPAGVLYWGGATEFGNWHAQTWLDPGDGKLVLTRPTTFNLVRRVFSSSIRQVIWAHGRWVAVGSLSRNGQARASALAFTSTDGTSWIAGQPAGILAEGDGYGETDWLTDLDALEGRERAMYSVAALPSGVIAVGLRREEGTARAAYWTTDTDLRTWTLADLPQDGLDNSYATSVRTIGATVVATGAGTRSGEKKTTGVVWRSADAGRTWSVQHLGASTDAQALVLAAHDSTFLVVQGREHDRNLDGWTSTDGVTWTPVAVDLPGRDAATRVSVADVIGNGDGFDLLLRVFDASDGRSVVHHVKIG